MKRVKIGPYEITAILLIALAVSLRVLLASQGWPRTNSDEDTIGLMALHIAYRGEHPIFYYGQNYMGALEAYLGAALFHIFGPSVFTLRLGLILLFALFLVSTYLLASLLYAKRLALVTLALLSFASSTVLIRELTAIGGYPETLLFGSLAFLLAFWLALSSSSNAQSPFLRKQGVSKAEDAGDARPLPGLGAPPNALFSPAAVGGEKDKGRKWLRLIGFCTWGLVIGLGLWSDFLILPFVLMSGLLLILFCWRELRKWAGLFLLLGLIIGAFPLIIYNLHAQPGQDSLSILWRLQHNVGTGAANSSQISLLHEIQGTIQVSLPTATGNPFCPITELPFLGPTSPNNLACSIVRTSWGVGFIILFLMALFLTAKSLWTSWREFRSQSRSGHFEFIQERQTLIRYFAQLMLLGSAALSVLSFALSPAPAIWPSIYSRYLIGLFIATPALISPLLRLTDTSAVGGIGAINRPLRVPRKGVDPSFKLVKVVVCSAILVLIGLTFLTGTILAFVDIPTTQAIDQQEYTMIQNLSRLGITHIYSDYWTCNRIIFESQEKVICGVIDDHLQPTHNRYPQYYAIVSADPHSAYAFSIGSSQSVIFGQQAASSGKHYQRFVFDGYVIYM